MIRLRFGPAPASLGKFTSEMQEVASGSIMRISLRTSCFGRMVHAPSSARADQPRLSLSSLRANCQSRVLWRCLSSVRRRIASRPLPHSHHSISRRLATLGNEMVKRSETRATVASPPSRSYCQHYVAYIVEGAARSAHHAWGYLC